jgi:hypothetical protein
VFLRAGAKLNKKIKLQSIEPFNFVYTVYITNCPPSLEALVDPLEKAILSPGPMIEKALSKWSTRASNDGAQFVLYAIFSKFKCSIDRLPD